MSSDVKALGGLPAADQTQLPAPPLELAVAEVRFVGAAATALEPAVGLRLREVMNEAGLSVTGMERAQQNVVSFDINATGEAQQRVENHQVGWQYADAERSASVTILGASIAVQAARYERWSVTMAPLIEAALAAVDEVMSPQVTDRVGLRYIDRFVDPSAQSPGAWVGRIHHDLIGPVSHPVFGDRLTAAQQQLELRLEPECGALIRHGAFQDAQAGGRFSYLLDIDTFDERKVAFDPRDIVDRAQALNRTALSLFQASLTDEYLRELKTREGGLGA
ncbi:TIGR04255 family protein [Cellulomonas sp. NPDC058312]|uniref:TIGR04255 family protein n=1 Tax=Cellulomonas sp. NPDC058312 TaxID=3346441 RepID=UPI0036E86007